VGGVTTVAAGVGSVVSSGALVPAVVGGLAASVMSVGADLSSEKTGGTTLNNCAPDNFWTLLGDLISMGGWLLILVILVPMVLGWILPGPLEKRKKKR
jgi:phosphate/sulfate permease